MLLLTASWLAAQGFDKAGCVPCTVDAIDHHVEWPGSDKAVVAATAGANPDQLGEKEAAALAEKMVSQGRGSVKVKVFLTGGARLFAIYPR